MAQSSKEILLKIKRQGQLQDIFMKSKAKNVSCLDIDGRETNLRRALEKIYLKIDESVSDEQALETALTLLQTQVNSIVENSDTEALNSLKEIADWIQSHGKEYNALVKLVEGIPKNKTVSEVIEEQVTAAKEELSAALSSSEATIYTTLETKVPTLENDNTGKVLVTRNGVNTWENLVEVIDTLDPEIMQEGVLYCVMIPEEENPAKQTI